MVNNILKPSKDSLENEEFINIMARIEHQIADWNEKYDSIVGLAKESLKFIKLQIPRILPEGILITEE